MLALVNFVSAPGSVELREVPVPEPATDEVLLRVKAVGLCGSDLHQYHGTQSWQVNWPVTLGHEFCGEIAALGPGLEGWAVGERVACETAARICGRCALCRSGHYNLCPERLGFGYGVDGAAAEFVAVPARLLHRLPATLSWEEAAVTEPCCVAANAVLVQSNPRPGDVSVVLGPGPVGLLCTALLALTRPAALIVAGIARDATRLELARRYGATRTVVSGEEDLSAVVCGLGDGLGAHLVIDAAGVSATLCRALELVRPAGQITKVGWGREPLPCSLDPLIARAVTLRGAFSHTWETWERVLGLLGGREIDVRPLVRTYPLAAWRDALAAMEDGTVAKPVLLPA